MKLTGDQRLKEIREPLKQSPVATPSTLTKSKVCKEGLSTACGVCPMLRVEKAKKDGKSCTKSRCGNKHWKGGQQWNRL